MGIIDRLLGRTPEQAFAGEVTAVLHRVPGVAKVEPGRRDLELLVTRTGTASPGVLRLDDLFRDVRGFPHVRRRAAIGRFVRAAAGDAEVVRGWREVSEQLLPGVRPAGSTGELGDGRVPVTWPVAPFLIEILAIEAGAAAGDTAYLDRNALAWWGITAETARLAAHQNLTRSGVAVVPAGDFAGAWWMAGPDSSPSSWLAAHGWLADAVVGRVEGDPLVLAPSVDRALVLGTGDPGVVAAALRWAESAYADGERPLSPVAYRLDRRRLEPWTPEPGHPCEPLVDRSQRLLASRD
jgi:hypothetical protein